METKIGNVSHYFKRISVAVIKINEELKVGDKIKFQGHTTDFEQVITSLEIDHKKVDLVKPGDDFALKVRDRVRLGDSVYKLE